MEPDSLLQPIVGNDITAFGEDTFGLSAEDALQLFMKFNRSGFWRLDVDTGHLFCCSQASAIFGVAPSDGPVDMVALTSRIHPDDLAAVMEGHEAAAVHRVAIQKTYRVVSQDNTYKQCCSIGRFREKEGTGGEIVGITYEMPPQYCELLMIAPTDQP
jgi:PAS fold